MKPSSFLILIMFATSVWDPALCQADDPLEFTFFLTDSEGAEWRLMRLGDQLVFVSTKPRPKPNNNKAAFDSIGTIYICIEPENGGEPVSLPTIRLLDRLSAGGPYSLSMEKLKGYPKGYLTADYSTDPPTVRLEKTPGKEGRWKFIDSGKLLQAFIKHEGDHDKPGWLSLADSGSNVPADEKYGKDMVFEFRGAILTPEKKHPIRIRRHYESK